MNGIRLGLGGIVVLGIVAVACGSAVGRSDGTPAADTPPLDSSAEQVDETANAQPSLSDEDRGQSLVEPVTAPSGQSLTPFGRLTYLPEDATETPEGRPIFRDEQSPIGWGIGWNTNFNIRTVNLNEIFAGGPPRDGIPPIDDPKFVTIAQEDNLYTDNAPVIQFQINGDVRAYPLGMLLTHEIVNDIVGGVPVGITFCPLCNSAVAFERTIDGEVFDFGTSGTLRNSDLVMWDRQTESLWQQIGGEAIVGSMVGATLDLLPAPVVSWTQFKADFPDGLVLSQDTEFSRRNGDNPYPNFNDIFYDLGASGLY